MGSRLQAVRDLLKHILQQAPANAEAYCLAEREAGQPGDGG